MGIVFLLWIASAFAGSYVSAQKGRFWLEGFLFGLIFGPIGLIVAVGMPEPHSVSPSDLGSTEASRRAYREAAEEMAAAVREGKGSGNRPIKRD